MSIEGVARIGYVNPDDVKSNTSRPPFPLRGRTSNRSLLVEEPASDATPAMIRLAYRRAAILPA